MKAAALATARGFFSEFRLTIGQLRDPALALWGLYIALVPVYIWKSGLPQPGDWMVILMAPVVLFKARTRLSGPQQSTMRTLYMFVGWVILVNLGWTLILGSSTLSGKTGFYLAPIFYIYNTLVFYVFLVMYQRYGSNLLALTSKLILYTLILQVILVRFVGSSTLRTMVLFNNPNQLGYFALLSASLLVIFQRHRYATTFEVILGSLAATYLTLLSASRAALGGIVILALVASVARLRNLLAIGVVVTPLFFFSNPMSDALDRTISRLQVEEGEGATFATSFIEERGYDRIVNHPEYWALGAGEGNYRRFIDDGAKIGSHEIHSSIGTLVFCYGIVGVLIFGAFVWRSVKRAGFRTWLMVTPSLAYGMTHQALRFTLFWILLAIVLVLGTERQQQLLEKRRQAAERPRRDAG